MIALWFKTKDGKIEGPPDMVFPMPRRAKRLIVSNSSAPRADVESLRNVRPCP